MVSRRSLVAIILMMGVLFILFQFFLVMKDRSNQYMINEHYSVSSLRNTDVFAPKIVRIGESSVPEGDYVAYFGKTTSAVYPTVEAWCTYRKLNLLIGDSPQLYSKDPTHLPKLILIDAEKIDFDHDLSVLTRWEKETVPLVFMTLPPVKKVVESEQFMNLIGANYIMQPEEPLVGIHAFDGFLLGGETFYQVANSKDKDESERMDLNLDIPMYHVFNNTKSYIIGMFKETPEDTEVQPPLLWRYTTNSTNVFVVNGDFMKDISGMGYLEAILTEVSPYDIYPVVNAQLLSLVNFPGLSEENSEVLAGMYGRTQSGVYRDLVWPSVISVLEKSGMVPSCFMSPEMNYHEENNPSESELEFYLMQLKEYNGEMGLSLDLFSGVQLRDKIERDGKFFERINGNYHYGAVYAETGQLRDVSSHLDAEYLSDVGTLVTDDRETPLGYFAEDVSLMGITSNVYPYHFSDDLKLKGYETALGYSNILFDMENVIWPQDKKDEWQQVSKVVASNLTTFWKKYKGFEQVTVSEANRRVRNFLAVTFEQKRNGDVISLKLDNFNGEVWFVLRLHEEAVADVEGGSFSQLEEDAYLIHATNGQVNINLEGADKSSRLIQ